MQQRKVHFHAAKILSALGHSDRLHALALVLERERSVTELAGLLGITHSRVSQQLAVLMRTGLLNKRHVGRTVYFSSASPLARDLIRVMVKHTGPIE